MGVESYLVLWVFTDECCHPNRFRVELMLIESFEIGRLDFPNRDTLKSTHCFLPNETELSHRWRRRTWQILRTVSSNQTCASRRPAVGSSDWLDAKAWQCQTW